MRGILADNSNLGHVAILLHRLQSASWREIWSSLNLLQLTFTDLGLAPDAPDSLLWQVCQQQQVILITINRNARGPDSLEATIRADCLPVLTLANPDRILHDRDYVERVVQRLLEFLIDIDSYRGAGRLYLP